MKFTGHILISLFLTCMCLSTSNAISQNGTASDQLSAQEHIDRLKSGVLLVRLPSNRKKIEAIDKALQDNKLSESSRDKLKALKRLTLEETEETHRNYIDAFDELFDFCEVYFFMDYDTRKILDKETMPLRDDLSTPAKEVSQTERYILSIGATPGLREGLVVMDTNLQPLQKPFPRTVLTSGFNAFLGALDKESSENVFVKRLNKKLNRYYEKTR